MTMHWFAHNNQVTLADTDFLKNVGITIGSPRDESEYTVDEATGAVLGCLGIVFVRTTGAITVRPHHQIGDRGIEKLLRTAVDCVERDLHIREKWPYRRKTPKRPGHWYGHICAALPPASELRKEIKALDLALKSSKHPPIESDLELSE